MHTDIPPLPSGKAAPPHRATGLGARVRFDAGACLSVRYPDLECGLCLPACPVSAIGMDGRQPALHSECLGCGQCAAVCPTAAFGSDAFGLPARLAVDVHSVNVDCWRVPIDESPAGALRVPCLAGAGTGWLLALFELGGEQPLHLLDRGGCENCPAGGGERIESTLAEVRQLLREAGVSEERLPIRRKQATAIPLLDAIPDASAARAISRRNFFSDLIGGAARAADEVRILATPLTSTPSASLPSAHVRRRPVQPIERLRVVASLSRIAARHERAVPGRVLPRLSLGDCDAHGVCAVVCPTGALHQHVPAGSGVLELRFDAAQCIACGQCAQVCPEGALRLEAEGGQVGREVLGRWTSRPCPECGEFFFGAASQCCPDCVKKVNLQQGMAALFRPFA